GCGTAPGRCPLMLRHRFDSGGVLFKRPSLPSRCVRSIRIFLVDKALVWSLIFSLCLPGWSISAQEPGAQQRSIDASISRALHYLSEKQTEEGAWITEAWGESTAITSLAIMAFLA